MKEFFCILPILSLVLGCGTNIEQKHPGEMFEKGTGMKMPAGVKELHAKNLFYFAVGDSFYLKCQGSEELEKLLNTKFSKCFAKPDELSLAPDIVKSLGFWNETDMKDDVCYGFELFAPTTGEPHIPVYHTYVSFDPKTRVTYIMCETIRQ